VRGPSVVRVKGPLAPYARGFGAHLVGRGYTPSSAEDQLRLMAHVSRWLAGWSGEPAALTPQAVERFLGARRASYVKLTSRRALVPLLGYLRGLGVVPEPDPALVDTPVERLLADYRDWLVRERGLAAGSVRLRERVARLFLAERSEPIELALGRLQAGEVTAFVLAQCRSGRRGVSSAKTLTSGLRSLLRFLHVAGWVPVPLAQAVPSVAGWRLGSLPRALEAEQVERLLESCDRSTALGRRDFAILTLLSRLGLRGFEVAALSLEDIDWRAGELTIRGKGARTERLPLPHDVGETLVDYLRSGRPRVTCREVFVRARAPHCAICAAGVRSVVHHACDRAGMPRIGAHRLRHTVASELLRAGAPLQQIAQVLRHSSLASTAIYAKVDRAALRTLARPWPLEGGAA
jgi:integrase/recombinase XerD